MDSSEGTGKETMETETQSKPSGGAQLPDETTNTPPTPIPQDTDLMDQAQASGDVHILRRSDRVSKPTEKVRKNKLQQLEESLDLVFQDLLEYIAFMKHSADTSMDNYKAASEELYVRRTEIVELHDRIRNLSFGRSSGDVTSKVDRACAVIDKTIRRIDQRLNNTDTHSTITYGSCLSGTTRQSRSSSASERLRQEAAAKVAAMQVELQLQDEENEREDELKRLENEERRRREDAEALLERKRRELNKNKREKQLRMEQAKLQVYDGSDRSNSGSRQGASHKGTSSSKSSIHLVDDTSYTLVLPPSTPTSEQAHNSASLVQNLTTEGRSANFQFQPPPISLFQTQGVSSASSVPASGYLTSMPPLNSQFHPPPVSQFQTPPISLFQTQGVPSASSVPTSGYLTSIPPLNSQFYPQPIYTTCMPTCVNNSQANVQFPYAQMNSTTVPSPAPVGPGQVQAVERPLVGDSHLYGPGYERVPTSTFKVNAKPCHPSSDTEDLRKLSEALISSVSLNRLPMPEPTIFTGNPLEYPDWNTSFSALIESRGIPPQERIHYLKKYLSGPAKEAVSGYFLLQSENAYYKAKKILRERFGNPHTISNHFRTRLNNWQRIEESDNGALRKLSDFLLQCEVAMLDIPELSVLDDTYEMQKILKHLPDHLIKGWNRKVSQYKDDHGGSYPKFSDFARFLQRESEIACNPLTSLNSVRANPAEQTQGQGDKVKKRGQGANTFSTNGQQDEATRPLCLFCERVGHTLSVCRTFAAKSMDDKKQFIRKNYLCFGCLGTGHMSRYCQNRSNCKKCSARHPTCLHENKGEGSGPGSDTKAQELSSDKCNQSESKSATCNAGLSNEPISAMVLPVWVSTRSRPEEERLVYALLDTQSDTTFISTSVADKLSSSDFETTKIRLTTMTSNNVLLTCNKYKDLIVRGYDADVRISLPKTFSRNQIPLNESHIPTPEIAERWPHLREIASKLQPLLDCEIGLLIGYNCPQALAPRRCITGLGNEPFAVCTDLGWSVIGCSSLNDDTGDAIGLTHLTVTRRIPEDLISKVDDSLEVKFIFKTSVKEETPYGTMDSIYKSLEADFSENKVEEGLASQEDLKFTKIIQEGIHQQADGYFSMPLPFKHGKPSLPNNRFAISRRLETLKRRMIRDNKYANHYRAFMEEILARGDAEAVPQHEDKPVTTWYIPHHGVYHPQKKDKIRVVFDCSAKFQGTSLNQHLLTGPDLINPLIGVLCRFRQEPIAVTCDIEKMFHQFRVNKEDQDYLRFLWWEGGDLNKDPIDHRMKVHLFGAASSPGCANYGLKEIAQRCEEDSPAASNFIRKDFYVDDGLKSVPTADEGIAILSSAIDICRKGNLRLHKILSNSQAVLDSFPESERSKTAESMNLDRHDDGSPERALGVQWLVESDKFTFCITLKDLPFTRRGILATVASVYDPMGFLAPFVLVGKLILQELCVQGSGWDDPITEETRMKWQKWRQQLLTLQQVKIQRCYKPKDFGMTVSAELHHFSDASTEGYGQCSYIRLKNDNGHVCCAFVMGKSRVTPRKPVTIPRLELQAAVTSVKISNLLNVELEYSPIKNFFWTDSKVVLGYIQNEVKRFHVYVANRVQRIRDASDAYQWRYISTKENPADHASRGLDADSIMTSNWLTGPSFLWEENIPLLEEQYVVCQDDPELKKTAMVLATASTTQGLEDRLEKFSSWTDAVKGLTTLRLLAKRKSGKEIHSPVEETRITELRIIAWTQKSAFSEEIHALEKGALPHRLKALDPILEDGIIRVGGRITNSSLDKDTKHPIILPKRGHITTLLVRHLHEEVAHQGRGITLNHIRSSGYWVMGGSSVVSSIIFKCFNCRKMRGTPTTPKMADLPKERVEPSPPFTTCGMDCFGPFLIKEGRKEHKRYGVIFTCLALRAIHVEVLDDMTTDALINALRCLFAIRGRVRLVHCDQGSNFIGAKQELKQALLEVDDDKLCSWLLEHQCDFKFNPPSASHMGGVWERQIRSVRTVLDGLLENNASRLDTSSLRTLMYEAMAIVNGRPLTTQNVNDPSSPAPLTPNHLLTMKSDVVPPAPGKFVQEDVYARKRWRKVQYLANEFWQRWRKEYLTILQSRQKWQKDQRNLQVGDVVLLKEENLVRGQWTLARVEDVEPSNDNVVRKVKLLIATSNLDKNGKRTSKPTILERPVHKVTLLVEND